MIRLIKIVLLLFFPIQLFGQITIQGRILDSISHIPVPFASVYIDRSTRGTLTDSTGQFTLAKVNVPSRLIVSQVGYITKTFIIDESNRPDSIIFIPSRNIGVNEITVQNKSLRQKNLKLFKERFLGDDKWGHNAVIENEDALKFNLEYDTIQINKKSQSKINSYKEIGVDVQPIEEELELKYKVRSEFYASSIEPLIIDLPLTGYKLYFDLWEFVLGYNPESGFTYWKYLGYSLYKPINPKSNSELFKYKRNRLNVYYNSPMHLFRSMYANKLRQNGYSIVEMVTDSSAGGKKLVPMSTDNWVYKNNTLEIAGNKGKNFYIAYFTNINGEPLNLEKRNGSVFEQSQMYFMSDTCIIRENGTLESNTILFRPFIGTKQIGASLPNDFKPGPGKL